MFMSKRNMKCDSAENGADAIEMVQKQAFIIDQKAIPNAIVVEAATAAAMVAAASEITEIDTEKMETITSGSNHTDALKINTNTNTAGATNTAIPMKVGVDHYNVIFMDRNMPVKVSDFLIEYLQCICDKVININY